MSSSDDHQADQRKSDNPPNSPANVEPISEEIREALRQQGIDPDRPDVRQTLLIGAASHYAGPIPPASMLEEYECVRPGLANEIVGWAERQQTHRRGLELRVTRGSESRMDRAQWFAFAVALVSIIVAGVVAVIGSPWAAAAIAAIGVGGPSAATIFARFIGSPTISKPESKDTESND